MFKRKHLYKTLQKAQWPKFENNFFILFHTSKQICPFNTISFTTELNSAMQTIPIYQMCILHTSYGMETTVALENWLTWSSPPSSEQSFISVTQPHQMNKQVDKYHMVNKNLCLQNARFKIEPDRLANPNKFRKIGLQISSELTPATKCHYRYFDSKVKCDLEASLCAFWVSSRTNF